MSFDIQLYCIAKIKPEFHDFISEKYFFDTSLDPESNEVDERFKDLYHTWCCLGITRNTRSYFTEFNFIDAKFSFKIEKNIWKHTGNLNCDYLEFVRNIIRPISTHIIECYIDREDHILGRFYYKDDEFK